MVCGKKRLSTREKFKGDLHGVQKVRWMVPQNAPVGPQNGQKPRSKIWFWGPKMGKSPKVKLEFGTLTIGKSHRNKIWFWAPEPLNDPVGPPNGQKPRSKILVWETPQKEKFPQSKIWFWAPKPQKAPVDPQNGQKPPE
jgi:hypothetical protein